MANGTTDNYNSINIRDWERIGVLTEGTRNWCWVDGKWVDCISVEAQLIRVILRYRVRKAGGGSEAIEDPISLDLSEGGLGRERLWFRCSGCGKRAVILYLDKYFRCRRCHGLVYRSQQVSPSQRTLGRIQTIRTKLGGSPSLIDSFPPKPRYMRWTKYFRMMNEDEKLMSQYLEEM